ncbi:MAG: homoserine O-succinyltransferase [Gammaproteobacteria bacterium]|nr:homoserine O-succinyltransferase [Gammaproteobacteria bacterium]MDH5803446.1 homoserine O-succinyltransferase [Gammaproteobacteria bacterium]
MPLVASSGLPTFERLKREGETILSPNRAAHQDIRELHIGLLNMMPDAALAATERQFFRLVNDCNQIAQFYMHPFTIKELPRGTEGLAYTEKYYESFEQIQRDGLDALIITGANVTQADITKEPFWNPLKEVVDWALENVTSVLCSCLATHAVLQFKHGQNRRRLPSKCWGIFGHRVVDRTHPLVNDVNTVFKVPHSRFNEVSREQFKQAGLHILAEGEAGVHLAVSEDLFRVVYFQGHPEYDTISLMKEYKREINRYLQGERTTYPPFPQNYFTAQIEAILEEHRDQAIRALETGQPQPMFPEHLITPRLDNTWHDTAEAVIDNWIGKVYQVTNNDRRKPFMEGVDPNDPLQLKTDASP